MSSQLVTCSTRKVGTRSSATSTLAITPATTPAVILVANSKPISSTATLAATPAGAPWKCYCRLVASGRDRTGKNFNISDILDIPDLHLKQRGIPGPLKSLIGAATAEGASLVATATAQGASLIETATAVGASLIADAASAAISAEAAIEDSLPRNLSLGISQFCVGYTNHKPDCSNLPLNISQILPEAIKHFSEDVQNFVNSQFQPLKYLEGITAKVTSANFMGPFVIGIVFLVVLAGTLFFILFIRRSVTNNLTKVGICLLAVLCCIPFAIPMAILSYVGSNIEESGRIVSIEKGDAANLSIGAFVCAIIILALTSVLLALHGGDLESRA
ncbi:hypothetical protein V490_00385 [Pseudogymnoascus sp. VKM F-3557]|nr:hypothetical protein V490_00385 [Pseudogymnoascus sp. VKM F-3557]